MGFMPSAESSSELTAAVSAKKPSAVDRFAVFAGKLFVIGVLVGLLMFVLLCIAAAIGVLGVDDY